MLPQDLLDRRFRLIARAPDRLFAVSASWGCTATLSSLDQVVAQARALVRFLEYLQHKKG